MSTRSDNFDRAQAQCKKRNADLDALVADVARASAELRVAHYERIMELLAQERAARCMFAELRRAAESSALQLAAARIVAWAVTKAAIGKAASATPQ